MGGCIGSPRDGTSHSAESSDVSGAGNISSTVGHNKPLKHRRPKWKSDIRLTPAQLQQKRDEFWDTAPAFEGRVEIWHALKASAQALENGDPQMAQAILDGAGVSLPNGTLMDCYDELGNRYVLPVYVLSAPINLLREGSGDNLESLNSPDDNTVPEGPSIDVPIKLHLSSGSDLRLTVRSTDTIAAVKRQVQAATSIDWHRLRIFFAGRQLGDRQRIDDVKIHRGFTLQVVVASDATDSDNITPTVTVLAKPSTVDGSTASEPVSVEALIVQPLNVSDVSDSSHCHETPLSDEDPNVN